MVTQFKNSKEEHRYKDDILAQEIIKEYERENEIFNWMQDNDYDFKDVMIMIYENISIDIDKPRAEVILSLIYLYVKLLIIDKTSGFSDYVNDDSIIECYQDTIKRMEIEIMELQAHNKAIVQP